MPTCIINVDKFRRDNMDDADECLNLLVSKHKEALRLSHMQSVDRMDQMRSYQKRMEQDISNLPVVHVAGSKGKGSTSAFTESIQREHGLKTGFFASPHLVSVRERFRINTHSVDESTFQTHFWATFDALNKNPEEGHAMPPFFTFLTLVAFRMYIAQKVDVLVLEVGLGGRLDSTNIVPNPLATAIVPLLLEHTDVLGTTIEAISGEKAGIIKKDSPVVLCRQPRAALPVLFSRCVQNGVLPLFVNRLSSATSLGLVGYHQFQNAAVACILAAIALKKVQEKNPDVLHRWSARDTQDAELAGGMYERMVKHQLNVGHSTDTFINEVERYQAQVRQQYGWLLGQNKSNVSDYIISNKNAPLAIEVPTPIGAEEPTYGVLPALETFPVLNAEIPPLFLRGLHNTKWGGRCQVVKIDDQTSFYLDGAHTPDSVDLCVNWFQGCRRPVTQEAVDAMSKVVSSEDVVSSQYGFLNQQYDPLQFVSSIEDGSEETILMFSCGHTRCPLNMLAPLHELLTKSAPKFSRVFFVPFDDDRLHLMSRPSLHTLMPEEKLLSDSYHLMKEHQSELSPALEHVDWQMTQLGIWAAYTSKNNQPPQDVLNSTASQYMSFTPKGASYESVVSSDTPLHTARMGNAFVYNSVSDALAAVRQVARKNPSKPVKAQVTGSLYLVGNVLKALKVPLQEKNIH